MRYTWRIHGGTEEDSEEEESFTENVVPLKGVSESFCQCVDKLKWRMYESVVLSPELNTPDAQQNKLLQTYEGLLEQLFEFLEQALKGSVKESSLTSFPVGLRHEILKCAQDIQRMRQGGGVTRYIDRIPYHDYLQTQLRVYPYLQYRGHDVE